MNIDNLKIARKKCGMTQKEVADRLGIGQSTYKNYECGFREPNGDTIVSLADLFHTTTDYLLGRDSGEPSPLDKLTTEFNMSALERKIVDNYLSMPTSLRGDLMEFLQKSVREVMENGD